MIWGKTIVKKRKDKFTFNYTSEEMQDFYEALLDHLMENDSEKWEYFIYLAGEKINEKINEITE